MASWTMLTCEYPPRCGGVGDYTAQVARALSACGDHVTVCCPPQAEAPAVQTGVDVVVLPDTYGRESRRRIADRLAAHPTTTVLVQYVPTAFGLKGANLPWCRWLADLSRQHGDVRVMFHEPYFTYRWKPLHQTPLSMAQRLMARWLLTVGKETYVSTDSWRQALMPYAADAQHHRFVTLPIPSSVPRCERTELASDRRQALIGTNRALVGHFGTYGTHVAPLLRDAALQLLSEDTTVAVVCIGDGSDRFVSDVVAARPDLEARLHSTGRLAPMDTAAVIAACDILLQPYPDGVTTRRTSIMAALHNSRAVVTTTGHLTEPLWAETGAVAMTPAGDAPALVAAVRSLLARPTDVQALAARGDDTYRRRLALVHTIETLRRSRETAVA
jgi:glycosyltransferase involved in cell wall biosynthesis